MKKVLISLAVIAVLASAVVLCCVQYMSAAPSVSEETMALARSAVGKAKDTYMIDVACSDSLCRTAADIYETTEKGVTPELANLEARDDASLALIVLYGEVLADFREADLDEYYEHLKKVGESAEPVPRSDSVQHTDDLFKTRWAIEAMLSIDCYYDRLAQSDIDAMTELFNEFADIEYNACKRHYSDAQRRVVFESCRLGNKQVYD